MYTSRYKILRAAYAAWRRQCEGLHGCAHYYPDAYYAFTLENESWLEDYALYMALKTANQMKSWTEWPRAYRMRDGHALAAFRAEHEEEIGFWKFLQYEFAIQWKKLKAYANAKASRSWATSPSMSRPTRWTLGGRSAVRTGGGRQLCPRGRLPAGLFLRRRPALGQPAVQLAVSPRDRLCLVDRAGPPCTGHLRPAPHRPLPRLRYLLGYSGGSTTAKGGKWEIGPRMELFHALENALGKLPIIAEDLGDIVDSVRELLAESGFPGMKVLQFAFGGGDNEYLPHNHVRNSVVYPGTHDNMTLTAWWETGASEKEKAMACAYLHLTPCHPTAKEVAAVKTDAARVALLRAALGSAFERAIIPMADWLGLGEEGHLNTPGRLGGNWTWRAAEGFGTKKLAKEILGECEAVCRA